MAIDHKIYDFPTLAVQSELFYAGGQAYDGGFTTGSARIMSPEPGGRSFLEVQLSLQVNEWDAPFTSWLMSKVNNGTVFRINLTKTPQLVGDAALGVTPDMLAGSPWEQTGLYPDNAWDNGQFWANDGIGFPVTIIALEGTTGLTIDTADLGEIIRHGHVIGVGDVSYMVDDIEYDSDTQTARITVNPPLRNDVTDEDMILLRPSFLGVVMNASEVRTAYERSNNGHIQPGRILFSEFIR